MISFDTAAFLVSDLLAFFPDALVRSLDDPVYEI